MSSPLNDAGVYYRISSDIYAPDVFVYAETYRDAPGPLYLNNTLPASQNWQVFYQDNVYFLRNYDYGAQYQLGINLSHSTTEPQLLLSSGDLSQQWDMTLWPDGTTRKLTNMAIGEFQFLGVSNTSDSSIIPVMNTAERGSHWIFDINSSAGDTSEAMQAPLSSVATRTSTSTTAQSTEISTMVPTTTSATASSTPPATTSSAKPSNELSSGGIAGVTVGAVVLAALAVLAILFVIWRRRRLHPSAKELPASNTRQLNEMGTHDTQSHRPAIEMKHNDPPVEMSTNR